MSNWIKVSDGLPPIGDHVWLYDESTCAMWIGVRGEWSWGRSYGKFLWSDRDSRWVGECFVDKCDNTTHWAPLITPPSKYPSADTVYP